MFEHKIEYPFHVFSYPSILSYVLSTHNICFGGEIRELIFNSKQGAQWLSGRVLDSRQKGCWFKLHPRHCVVVLEHDKFYPSLVLVQPRKTRPYITERLLMGGKELIQIKIKSTLNISPPVLLN